MNAKRQYDGLYAAFAYFNSVLFDGKLSEPLFDLSKKEGTTSFFTPKVVQQDGEIGVISEIGLGLSLLEKPAIDVMAELCRQMVRLWQEEYGDKKPRNSNYCNKEWSVKMKEIGLIPSEPSIGYNSEIEYCIDPEGKFMKAAKDLPPHVIQKWEAISPEEFEGKKNKGGQRTAYVCSNCNFKAWAKNNAEIICGKCKLLMIPEVKTK